jgi:hypothetical protein
VKRDGVRGIIAASQNSHVEASATWEVAMRRNVVSLVSELTDGQG